MERYLIEWRTNALNKKYTKFVKRNNQVYEKKYTKEQKLIRGNQPHDSYFYNNIAPPEASNHRKINKKKILYGKRSCVRYMMRQ